MWSVDIELVMGWLASLDDDSRVQVVAAIELLEVSGPQLGQPIVDTVTAFRHLNVKELQEQHDSPYPMIPRNQPFRN